MRRRGAMGAGVLVRLREQLVKTVPLQAEAVAHSRRSAGEVGRDLGMPRPDARPWHPYSTFSL